MEKKVKQKSLSSFAYGFLENKSIRTQILLAVFVACMIMAAIAILTTSILRRTMSAVGDSFQTNADLNKYLTYLAETENAMETHMEYRTFESIDKYFKYLALSESCAEKLFSRPSTIPAKQKEYIIRQLSISYFNLTGNAIAARRANNQERITHYYTKCLQCYSFLRDEILSLNMLYFQSNAETYEKNKYSTTVLINTSIILMFVILLCAIGFIYLIVSKIVQPLSTISSVALKVADKDFDVELFNSARKDEIGNICRAFDEMIISIRQYIDTIWEKAKKENELREKEIEMRALITESHFKALQEQIQPHFLFNTLNTGAGLAMMEGADKTCYFLEQVADFLRYNIQHPGQDATLKDELGMLDNYIYIMSVRFGNRYQFIKEIDEDLLTCRMPNMILQPLVENCIKHGLKDITENGIIKIVVRQDYSTGEINVLISDNGCGFNPELREQILKVSAFSENLIVNSSEINQNGHISTGLVNVISRLKFYFKKEDVFNIIPNGDEPGTTFFIKIPNV